MIGYIVARIKDMVWRYQFKRAPVTRLGPLLVKEFRGSLYCVGTIDEAIE